MAIREIAIENPIKRSRNPWMDFLIPSLSLITVKNHIGKNSKNNMTLDLANAARPNKIPEMKKIIIRLFSSPKMSDEIKRSMKSVNVELNYKVKHLQKASPQQESMETYVLNALERK